MKYSELVYTLRDVSKRELWIVLGSLRRRPWFLYLRYSKAECEGRVLRWDTSFTCGLFTQMSHVHTGSIAVCYTIFEPIPNGIENLAVHPLVSSYSPCQFLDLTGFRAEIQAPPPVSTSTQALDRDSFRQGAGWWNANSVCVDWCTLPYRDGKHAQSE